MTTPIQVYTDGASSGNPGPGGYGAILRYGKHEKELSRGFKLTTNNRMELLAVIDALKAIKKDGALVHIYTDSQYVVNAVEKGWVFGWERSGFKKKKNPDLWKEFLLLYPHFQIKFFWIRGHNGHPENERCDQLAVAASRRPEERDTVFEQLGDEGF